MIRNLRALLARRTGEAQTCIRQARDRWYATLAASWLIALVIPALGVWFAPSVDPSLVPIQWLARAWSASIMVLIGLGIADRLREDERWQVVVLRSLPACLALGLVTVSIGAGVLLRSDPDIYARAMSIKNGAVPTPEIVTLSVAFTTLFGGMLGCTVLVFALMPCPISHRLLYAAACSAAGMWGLVATGRSANVYWLMIVATAIGLVLGLLLDMPSVKTGVLEYENVEAVKRQAIRRRERELAIAASIQSSMNPPESWHGKDGVHVTSYQKTHKHVGGDWLAIRETADGRVIAFILDVTGKGVQAALIAHAAQSVWAMSLSERLFDPAKFLESLNTTLYRISTDKVHTATAGILEIDGGRLTYWSAAHCPVHVIFEDGTGVQAMRLRARGDMLGMRPKLKLKPATFMPPPGARLDILHGSDGIFDGLPLSPKGGLELLDRLRVEGPRCVEAIPVEDDKTLMWIRFEMRSTA